MSGKPNIARIIRDQRKRLSLSLKQLSKLSAVSVAHLGRIETGDRTPSTRILQKLAKPLGFDLYELFVTAGHLKPDHTMFSEEERAKLRAELNMLSNRVAFDIKRIDEIIDRLLMS